MRAVLLPALARFPFFLLNLHTFFTDDANDALYLFIYLFSFTQAHSLVRSADLHRSKLGYVPLFRGIRVARPEIGHSSRSSFHWATI